MTQEKRILKRQSNLPLFWTFSVVTLFLRRPTFSGQRRFFVKSRGNSNNAFSTNRPERAGGGGIASRPKLDLTVSLTGRGRN